MRNLSKVSSHDPQTIKKMPQTPETTTKYFLSLYLFITLSLYTHMYMYIYISFYLSISYSLSLCISLCAILFISVFSLSLSRTHSFSISLTLYIYNIVSLSRRCPCDSVHLIFKCLRVSKWSTFTPCGVLVSCPKPFPPMFDQHVCLDLQF